MLRLYPILAVMLATSPGAYAQDAAEPPQEQLEQPTPAAEPPGSATGQRWAVPRDGRRSGGNPRVGTTVPRAARPAPADRRGPAARRPTVIVRPPVVVLRPPAVYNNYYSYRRGYPLYGYGAFGLGYSYYDPYRRYPGGYSTYAGPGYYQSPYGYGYDVGELRLQISPRHAQVYVDGYYAGTVDDYDGAFQALRLESGPYKIEIVAPGYETMTFDVRISPGQKITYRSDLLPRP